MTWDDMTQPIEHPSVTLAIQHRERIAEYEAMREGKAEQVAERLAARERAPEPDLRAAVAELAEIVALLCDERRGAAYAAYIEASAAYEDHDLLRERRAAMDAWRGFSGRAQAIKRQLS